MMGKPKRSFLGGKARGLGSGLPGGLEREAFLRIVASFLTGGIQCQAAMT